MLTNDKRPMVEFTPKQWEMLLSRIKSPEFDKLTAVPTITQDEGQYVLIPHYERNNLANKFYTKCRFVDLQRRYDGEGMKAKWYYAIRTRRQGDFNAFRHFTNVTHIGGYAFVNNSLRSVIIPKGVTHIGGFAFMNNQLTSVTIPKGVETIGSHSFAENRLESVTIPEGVTHIWGPAFMNNQLTSVTIPKGVETIGEGAFRNNQLTSLTIPDSVVSIGIRAFANNMLTSVTIPEGVEIIGNFAFRRNLLESVTIPESVTSIGEGAFDKGVNIIRRAVSKGVEESKSSKLKF